MHMGCAGLGRREHVTESLVVFGAKRPAKMILECSPTALTFGVATKTNVLSVIGFIMVRSTQYNIDCSKTLVPVVPGFVTPCHGGFPPHDDYDKLIGSMQSLFHVELLPVSCRAREVYGRAL